MFGFVCLITLALSNALHVFTARGTLLPGESMVIVGGIATLCLVFLATSATWEEIIQYSAAVYGIHVYRFIMERVLGARIGDPRKLQ